MHKRIENLDLFRFIAIVSVIYLHVGHRFLAPYFPDRKMITIGKYGVEMFFVLSGFLIANLYYKNAVKKNLVKFWLQRFFRTYPPYLIALIISYAAVLISKKQSFDIGYIFFIQNFYSKIPFFLVSWSLCVEEHFYLLFPVLLLITQKIIRKVNAVLFFWILLYLLPIFIRYKFGNIQNDSFGYYSTATIFKFDGIVLGCIIAYVINNFTFNLKSNYLISFLLFITFICLAYWQTSTPSLLKYSLGYSLLVINAGLLLCSFYYSKTFFISKLPVVRNIALMAYSLYLTHTLVINFCEIVFDKFHISNIFFTFPLCIILAFIVGRIFYLLIEAPSITFRNKVLK
jgi:peptidoglycan/LPS O-acetylase OafA/YrhL